MRPAVLVDLVLHESMPKKAIQAQFSDAAFFKFKWEWLQNCRPTKQNICTITHRNLESWKCPVMIMIIEPCRNRLVQQFTPNSFNRRTGNHTQIYKNVSPPPVDSGPTWRARSLPVDGGCLCWDMSTRVMMSVLSASFVCSEIENMTVELKVALITL